MKNLLKFSILFISLITMQVKAEEFFMERGMGVPITDLEVKKVYLTKNCKVGVEIANHNVVRYPQWIWNVLINKSFLTIYKNGKGFKTMNFRDIPKIWHLRNPNGRLFVSTNVSVNKTTRVTARVDIERNKYPLEDENIDNNSKTRYLKCHRKSLDLAVKNIYLDNQCRVVVEVKNIGKRWLPHKVVTYRKPDSPSIYLYRNNRQWGGRTLWSFANVRYHLRPNGVLVYRSKLKVAKKTKITAIVDMTHKTNDANRANNRLIKTLKCNH